ncbi:hypothetical protein AYK59_15325 [Pseudomonas synxantha]|nr:hypothetical protein AYK59_15325 [Pseudomonas synxantha]
MLGSGGFYPGKIERVVNTRVLDPPRCCKLAVAGAQHIPAVLVVQEATQLHTLIGLVACGFGVALVPKSIAQSVMRDKVVFRRLLPNPAIGLYMSWNSRNESALINSFIFLLDANVVPHFSSIVE